jgi:hypothetical protein
LGGVNLWPREISRGRSLFKQSDVTKAVKGVVAAGVSVRQIEIDQTGKIVIMTNSGEPLPPSNALDGWMAKHAGQA